jgi:hypothetical protein
MAQSLKHALQVYTDNRKKKSGKTKVEADAALKFDLDALFTKWKAGNSKKAKKAKENKDEENSEHAPNNGELTAVLWRNNKYALNCSNYIKKKKERGDIFRFNTSPRKERTKARFSSEPLLENHIKQYALGARPENFIQNAQIAKPHTKKGKGDAGQSYPYVWEAHHMIPCSVFYSGILKGDKPQKIFNEDQQMLLLMSKYNVNHGQNMIPLPKHQVNMKIHDMVYHSGDHPDYTRSVQKQMQEVAKSLDKITDDLKKPHPEIVVEIAEQLAEFEDKLWKQLCKLGIKANDVINVGKEFQDHDYLNKNGKLS